MSPPRRRTIDPRNAAILLALAGGLAAPPAAAQSSRREMPPPTPAGTQDGADADSERAAAPAVDPKWLAKLDRLDRTLLDEGIGFAPPEIPRDVDWIGSEPLDWASLRGSVVVLQSWTTQSSKGRKVPARVARAIADVDPGAVKTILVHTPDGIDGAGRYLERKAPGVPVILDVTGAFCDAVGMYRDPTNIVIDRNGTVRHAGLNPRGLGAAVSALAAEPFDVEARPAPRPQEDVAETPSFPPITGRIDSALDVRGKRGPQFYVQKWVNGEPDARGKVVVLDFWATWCGPCVASIPHMNTLAERLGDQVCIVGISDESDAKFERGLDKRKLDERSFRYALALDRSGRMKSALQIRGIPHCIVLSKDWTVRWQGHPARLHADVLERIVAADAAGGDAGSTADLRRRWTRGR